MHCFGYYRDQTNERLDMEPRGQGNGWVLLQDGENAEQEAWLSFSSDLFCYLDEGWNDASLLLWLESDPSHH